MSREVDDRVISMEFDNSQFEKNVSTSLGTIAKLKSALNFGGATKGLEEIEEVSHFSFDGLANSVSAISDRFSVLGVMGMRAIENITDRIVNMGVAMAKSMTAIEQMQAGWNKYAEKTSSVQTIMAATRKEFGDVDNQMELVNAQLDKLNVFTDETSYNFLDMVNNIGKFTSNNVKLDTSVKAMEGIASWAAISGAGISGASRAMYNLSQSLAMGAVKLQDWKSIENANMATAEFKETAIQAAAAAGTLKKGYDGVYRTAKGTEVTIESFSQTLSDQWFTSEVLLNTLDKYGGFSDKLIEDMDELSGMTATKMLKAIDDYKAGTLDINKMAKESGVTAERMKEILEELSSDEFELGRRAFKAAQEAKTFQEAIDSVKDAVSTGWMNTFEIIFGNYEQAKELWTDLANTLYDIFAAGGEYRNEQLALWADKGGRDMLIASIKNIYGALESLIGRFSEIFHHFFPQWTGDMLYDITTKIYGLTKAFKQLFVIDKSATNLSSMGLIANKKTEARIKTLTTIIDAVVRTLRTLWDIVSKIAGLLSPIFSVVMKFGSWFVGMFVEPFAEFVTLIDIFVQKWLSKTTFFDDLASTIESAGDKVMEFLNKLKGLIDPSGVAKKAAFSIKTIFESFSKLTGLFKNADGSFAGLTGGLKKIWDFIKSIGSSLFAGLKEIFSGDFTDIKKLGSYLFETLQNLFGSLFSALGTGEKGSILDLVNSGAFLLIVKKLTGFFDGLQNIPIIGGFFGGGKDKSEGGLEGIKDAISGLFGTIGDGVAGVMDSISKRVDVESIKNLAISLALLAGSIWLLASIKPENLALGLGAVYILIEELTKALEKLGKSTTKLGTSAGISGMLLSMATSMLILAASLRVIAKIEPERLVASMVAISTLIWEMTAVIGILQTKGDGVPKGMYGLIGFAAAIWILAKALKPIAEIEPEKLLNSMFALSALIGELFVVAALSDKKSGIGISGGIGLIAFAAAIRIIIPAVKSLSELDPSSLMQGVKALAAIIAIMAAFVNLTKGTAGSIFTGVGMIAIAASMLILYKAVKNFGDMDTDSLSKGLAAIGSALLAMTVALKVIGMQGIVGALAITVVAGAINLLVPAIEKLGNLSLEQIGKAALVLVGAFVILGGAAVLLTPLAPTLLLLGVAMGLIAVSIAVAAAALTAFSGALNVFAGSLNVLVQQITDIIVSLAFGIMESAGAIAMAVVGVIVAIVSELGKGASDIIAAVVQLLVNIIVALDTHLPTLITAALVFIAKFIFALADGIANYGPVLILAVQNLVLSIGIFLLTALKSMVEQIPYFGGKAADAIDGVIGNIEGMMDESKAAAMGSDYMTSIGSGMETGANGAVPYIQSAGSIMKNATLENFDDIESAAAESGVSTVDTFATSMQNQAANMTGIQLGPEELNNLMGDSSVYQAAVQERTSTYLDGWTSPDALANATLATETFAGAGVTGIENKDQDFRQAGEGSATEVNNGFSSKNADFENAGSLGAMGFINGLLSKVNDGSVYGAGTAIGNAALEAARKALEEHSPSRAMEQVGIYAGEGFVNGIKKTVSTVASAATNLGTSAIDGLSDVISTISDLVDTDLNLNPVITPVFDTSNIAKGARKVNGLLANTSLVGVTADSATTNQNGGNTGGMTFIQNNYSPKELSRAELYRQTRNQFAAARGLVNAT